MKDSGYTDLEKKVIKKMLAGRRPKLLLLRKQFLSSKIKKREFSSLGFDLDFEKSQEEPAEFQDAEKYYPIAGANVDLYYEKEIFLARFILWVKNGYLYSLEAYVHYGDWPNKIEKFKITDVDQSYI